jgi:hypothetical protein
VVVPIILSPFKINKAMAGNWGNPEWQEGNWSNAEWEEWLNQGREGTADGSNRIAGEGTSSSSAVDPASASNAMGKGKGSGDEAKGKRKGKGKGKRKGKGKDEPWKWDSPGQFSRQKRDKDRIEAEVKNLFRANIGMPLSAAPLAEQIRWERKLRLAEEVRQNAMDQVMAEAQLLQGNQQRFGVALAPSYLPPGHGIKAPPQVPPQQCPQGWQQHPPLQQQQQQPEFSFAGIQGYFQGAQLQGPSSQSGLPVASKAPGQINVTMTPGTNAAAGFPMPAMRPQSFRPPAHASAPGMHSPMTTNSVPMTPGTKAAAGLPMPGMCPQSFRPPEPASAPGMRPQSLRPPEPAGAPRAGVTPLTPPTPPGWRAPAASMSSGKYLFTKDSVV